MKKVIKRLATADREIARSTGEAYCRIEGMTVKTT